MPKVSFFNRHFGIERVPDSLVFKILCQGSFNMNNDSYCYGPNVTLFIHITLFTKVMKNVANLICMTSFMQKWQKSCIISYMKLHVKSVILFRNLFIYESVCVENVAYIPFDFSYMRDYMCKKCHVWSIASYRVLEYHMDKDPTQQPEIGTI